MIVIHSEACSPARCPVLRRKNAFAEGSQYKNRSFIGVPESAQMLREQPPYELNIIDNWAGFQTVLSGRRL
jgi:hypothetical protein